MKISTTRFGEIECKNDAVINFPAGIIGFPDSKRYIMLDHDREMPFKWLQSVDQGELAFVVMDPKRFKPDYRIQIPHEDVSELQLTDEQELVVFVILTVPSGDPQQMTANLRGPVVVNSRTKEAKQLILRDEYPTRYPIFGQAPVSAIAQSCAATPAKCHR